MKRLYILLVCLFVMIQLHQLQAQRCLPGQKGIQFSGGLVDGYKFIKSHRQAYSFGTAFSVYSRNANKWVYGLEYLKKGYCYRCQEIPVAQFTGEAGYYYNIWANRGKDVFINLGGSGVLGYETSNWGKKLLPDGATLKDRDKFIGGGIISIEAETYVIDKLTVSVYARERFTFGSTTGVYHFQVGISMRYLIY